ncbi:integral membrane protein [Seiridium cupressi]
MTRNIGFDVNPGGTRLVIAQLVFLFLAWLVCLLRAHVKIFMTKKILPDDWLMLVSLVRSLISLLNAKWISDIVLLGGTGKHTSELTPDGIEVALRAWYLCEVLYAPLSAIIRTSIALFVLRLASKRWQIWTITINLAIVWLVSITYFFLMALQCLPPNDFWQGPVRAPGVTGACINHDVVPIATVVHSSVSAVSDWVLGLLPIAMLWNIAINRRTKFSIAVLLSMGFIAGVALIVRIPYVKKIAISADFLSETIDLAVWSVIEPSLGIMAGCIVAIRPLFNAWGFGLGRSRHRRSDQPSGSESGRRGPVVPRWRALRNSKKLYDHSDLGAEPFSVQPEAAVSAARVSDVELKAVETVSDQRTMEGPNAIALDLERGISSEEEGESSRAHEDNTHTPVDMVS